MRRNRDDKLGIKEIDLSRLLYKTRQLKSFNSFFTAGEDIFYSTDEVIVGIPVEDKREFIHLLRDLRDETIKIEKSLRGK